MELKDLTLGMTTLYDVHTERAGNTMMRVERCWEAVSARKKAAKEVAP